MKQSGDFVPVIPEYFEHRGPQMTTKFAHYRALRGHLKDQTMTLLHENKSIIVCETCVKHSPAECVDIQLAKKNSRLLKCDQCPYAA